MVSDFVRKADEIGKDKRDFYLSPSRWRTSEVGFNLTWSHVKFTERNRGVVPTTPGVYAFIVQHDNGHFPPHGFIMYIGITGSRNTERTLQKRYYDYLQEQKRGKRPRVHYMLDKYCDDIYFYYVSIDDEGVDLEKLELDLNDAILPPVVVKDFSGEIRALVGALR